MGQFVGHYVAQDGLIKGEVDDEISKEAGGENQAFGGEPMNPE